MLPGHGTQLFIEGLSFVIDEGRSLDKQIRGAKARAGAPAPEQSVPTQER